MLLRTGDTVQVIAGADKGTIAKIIRIDRDKRKVTVEGVAKVYKHIRPSQRNPKGGRVAREMPIDASNVLLVNPDLGRGVRVGVKFLDNGDKVRVCKKTGRELGLIRKAKAKKTPATGAGAK